MKYLVSDRMELVSALPLVLQDQNLLVFTRKDGARYLTLSS